MDRLKIILLESALETVPQEIWRHPAVVKNARRRGKKPRETLLDVSLHYHAMKNLKDREKRGRPDIVHTTLLELLESPLNKEGHLEVYVHTYQGHVIFIDPSTRIPRNYNRFVGLMEQLFKYGKVPPDAEKPLIYIKTLTLEKLLEIIGCKGLVILWEKGERTSPENIVSITMNNNYAIGIGGFPHGDFSEEIISLASYKFSIYNGSLNSWVVASRIVYAAEKTLGILL